MKFGARQGRATNNSPHDLARQLSAQRLSLPLPAAEATWLTSHLRRCPACAAVDGAYQADQELLHRLAMPEPPRDLFARISVAIDQAEREQANREVAGPPMPGTLPARSASRRRSIRAFQAVGRASARRDGRDGAGDVRPGHGSEIDQRWIMPFAGLAAVALITVIGGTALLTETFSPVAPINRPGSSLVAGGGALGGTPIPAGAADVAWLSPVSDGTYTLNSAHVDGVCASATQPDCASFDGSEARQIPNLKTKPRAVLKSPSRQQLVVVETGTQKGGSSVYVLSVPAAIANPSAAPGASASAGASSNPQPPSGGSAGPRESPEAIGSAPTATTVPPTSEPSTAADASTAPESSPNPAPSSSPEATGSAAPNASDTPASASPITPGTPEPTAAATLAIISNVIVMGETAAYSPDGTMLAFSARPADGSHGPDIYLWRVGDPEAKPVTTDHASMFSGWWGSKLIGSRAIPQGEDASAGQGPTTTTPNAPSTAPEASDAGGSGAGAGAGDGASASPEPTSSAGGETGAGTTAGLSGGQTSSLAGVPVKLAGLITAAPSPSAVPVSPEPSTSPEPTVTPRPSPKPTAKPGSSATPTPTPTPKPIPRPTSSPTPTATPAATEAPSATPDASAPAATAGESAAPTSSATPIPATGPEAVPQSFLIDSADGSEAPITSVSAWRPVVDPTGRFVVYWSGRLRYDAATLSWLPGAGQLLLASWPAFSRSDPAAILAPTQLLPDDPDGAPSGDWDIRWDETGGHLAVWIADSDDSGIGRLSLLTIDPSTATTIPAQLLLHDAPAVAGFSLANERLAWATPPGQNGEGSRLQVLAWTGDNAGKIDSQPASSDGAVIVVR